MTNQEILDNAPEGWTHYISKGDYKYWRLNALSGYRKILNNGNMVHETPIYLYCIRSRNDIERAAEMEKHLGEAVKLLDDIMNVPFDCGEGYPTAAEAAHWMQCDAAKWFLE